MASPFLGEIKLFTGNYPPNGWQFCDGSLLPINQNTALFSLLGTTYGGDGVTTFALPDLRSRVPVGAGNGPGLTPRTEGETGGQESVQLAVNQIPVHSHAALCSTSGGNLTSPAGNVWARQVSGVTAAYQTAAPDANLAAAAVGSTGGGGPHENRQSFLAVNYIISKFGIFPSRN